MDRLLPDQTSHDSSLEAALADAAVLEYVECLYIMHYLLVDVYELFVVFSKLGVINEMPLFEKESIDVDQYIVYYYLHHIFLCVRLSTIFSYHKQIFVFFALSFNICCHIAIWSFNDKGVCSV